MSDKIKNQKSVDPASEVNAVVSSRLPKGNKLQFLAGKYAKEQNNRVFDTTLQNEKRYIDKKNCVKIVNWLIKEGY